ncbi:DUF4976 domain-containing protein [Labilibacter sediminis]|nr:DUF4976 domain-containing protein [Labilibacter sediminis]
MNIFRNYTCISTFFCCLLALGLFSCKEEVKKPNIIFLFADDQNFNTIHAAGNTEIFTPNLDKMVQDGTYFSHNFNMGGWNGAVCIASRTMINSGRSIWRAHQIEKQLKTPEISDGLWGNIMKKAGYETYMTGKWHIQNNPQDCFTHTGSIRAGMPKQSDARYSRTFTENDTLWQPYKKEFGGFWDGGKHWTEVLGDEALEFLDDAKEKDKPFFMYLAFNAPHDPRQSPKEFVDMYPLENIAIPNSYMPLYPYRDSIDSGIACRDERLAPFPRTKHSVKVNRQEYYAIITHLDQQIGRILAALKATGKMENTYIFYTADHGLACGNHGLIGKQSLFDHSVRAPLIVIGPDIPKNNKVNAEVYLQDIMPSSLELAGVEKPTYVEFSSLLDLAKGKQTNSSYKAIYGCFKNVQRMVRKDGYKLILYPKVPKVLLFDLNNDPEEINDISMIPENETKIKELYAELVELQKEFNDTLDLRKAFPMLSN